MYDRNNNITSLLNQAIDLNPKKLALSDNKTNRTYKELKFLIKSSSQILLDKFNVLKGDRVAIYSENSVMFIEAFFSILNIGAVAVLIDPNSTNSSLKFLLDNSEAKCAYVSDSLLEKFSICVNTYNLSLRNIIILGSEKKHFKGLNIIKHPENVSDVGELTLPKVSRFDTAEILYTTGTTGSPKGVVLSHHNVISAISNITKFIGYTNKDHEVITLPLTHSFGLNHVLCNIAAGGSVHIENGLLRLKKVFAALRNYKSTGFPGTPSSFSIILGRYTKNFIEAAKSLKFIVINSAPLPPTQAKEILKLIPHVKLLVYYGMTEASRATFIKHSLSNEKLLYSVGKASPNVKIAIIDNKNRFLSSGEVGEVVIKAETVMKGYWKNYEETKKIMLDGGWLKTGDLGYLNKNKYLFLVGRMKELINIGGLKVSPIEIEEVYKNCDLIDEFSVVGKKDKTGISGEKIIGFVKFYDERTMSENQLIHFAQGKIENYKIPSKFHIISEMPKSETGKLLREKLIKLAGSD